MSIYFTKKGYELQKAKMSDLEIKLRDLQKGIQSSFDDGRSIHDNANYETLIHEIEIVIKRLSAEQRVMAEAKIIEYPAHFEKIYLGAEVILTLDSEKKKIQIVAYGESDPVSGKIAYEAPLARALMGREPGEKITAQIGDRSRKIEIETIGPITKS